MTTDARPRCLTKTGSSEATTRLMTPAASCRRSETIAPNTRSGRDTPNVFAHNPRAVRFQSSRALLRAGLMRLLAGGGVLLLCAERVNAPRIPVICDQREPEHGGALFQREVGAASSHFEPYRNRDYPLG